MFSAEEQEKSNSWKIWVSGVVIGAVVLLAGWLIFTDPPSSGQADQPPNPTTAEQNDSGLLPDTLLPNMEDSGGNDSDCPDDRPTSDEPITEGPEVEWEIVNTLALPLSEEHGPFIFTDTDSSCYSQTPTGALIATVHSQKWGLSSEPDQALRNLTLSGEGQDRILKELDAAEAEGGQATTGEAESGTFCQVAGFEIVDYIPSRAVIDMAFRCPEGGFSSTNFTMVWDASRETWLNKLQPDGLPGATSGIADPTGYVTWGAF